MNQVFGASAASCALALVVSGCSVDATTARDDQGGPIAQAAQAVSATHTLRVRLVHANGSPVAWGWLDVRDASGAKVLGGNSADGTFALHVADGVYEARGWDGSASLGGRTVWVAADADVTIGAGAIATHDLHVHVARADGSGAAWAWVEVDDATGADLFHGNTDSGDVDVLLATGRYSVRAWDGAALVGEADVDVASDSAVTLREGGGGGGGGRGDAFVRASGTKLTLAGASWRFKGLNIYNANSRDNCWTSLAKGDALDVSLTQIGAGQNAFRAWFFQSLATSGGARDWAAFDHAIATAKRHGEKIVATLGNQWRDCDPEGYKSESWYSGGYQSRQGGQISAYRDWVEEVVTRYRDEPTIAMWQLMNEAEDATSEGGGCSSSAASTLRAFARDVSDRVKRADPNHLVSLGTAGNGQCGGAGWGEWKALHDLPSIDLCEYHDYDGNGAISPLLKQRIDECHQLGKPIFVGEMGILGSVQGRAGYIDAKLTAQFAAGSVGELIWHWGYGDSPNGSYEVVAGDPILGSLEDY